ncbi:hypothetical protein BCR33DRAFT_851548 [Rhizoclosmatium globosum]|uniref:Uncharacterized protein n=1 Tax=Rhizoclosmatium globosum TaxID=329046 RepID=A0A1Y2C614_9FUNG|nr:hypothetical protein BCR33DRAFT_851548 [Rhizoclosmatium globosum]|eukprot:ORY42480.1 hypothetical protein BCR33DRAFT_851548 [Rhizoclosmatium globosum]
MESAPPNKLIPLLLFGLRDPNSHLHKFARDIESGYEWGKVGYLTMHESYVQEGAIQRRPGLHIESPGNLPDDPFIEAHAYQRFYCWGGGNFGTGIGGHLDQFGNVNVEGGIFMASNWTTCGVWDCMISEHSCTAKVPSGTALSTSISFCERQSLTIRVADSSHSPLPRCFCLPHLLTFNMRMI